MPKAFTYLCKDVNLSLYDNTLTIYPKSEMVFSSARNHYGMFTVIFMQMNCSCARVSKMFNMQRDELGVYRFVSRQDNDHYLYHQDDFNMADDHYHAQFSQTIDEVKLEHILSILELYAVITREEHANFISAYHDANALPVTHKLVDSTTADKKEAKLIVPKPSEESGDKLVKHNGGLFFAAPVTAVRTTEAASTKDEELSPRLAYLNKP